MNDRNSRFETVSINVQKQVVIPIVSNIFINTVVRLPWDRETVFLHRMSVHSDRGVPANTNEEPIFTKLLFNRNGGGLNWAFFVQPLVTPTPPATVVPFQALTCNSLKDFVGHVQLKPGNDYLLSTSIDTTGLVNGDNVLNIIILTFEVVSIP